MKASQGVETSQGVEGSAAATRPLTIALPKGRSLKPVARLLEHAGVTSAAEPLASLAAALSSDSRALVRAARFDEQAVDLLLLKPDDVPTYVEYGTADVGVCGRDVLIERDVDVYQPVDLAIARCRLVVAGRLGVAAETSVTGRLLRVATKFREQPLRTLHAGGFKVEIVDVHGSVEIAPVLGLADVIVDLVETGTTLAENGLEIKEQIHDISSVFIANRAAYKLRTERLSRLIAGLRKARAIEPSRD